MTTAAPAISGLLQGILPPVVTLVLVALVPVFIIRLIHTTGIRTVLPSLRIQVIVKESDCDWWSIVVYYGFLIANVLLVSCIAGSMFDQLYMVE